MTILPMSEVREKLSDVVNRVAYAAERIIIDRRGKHVAALVSVEDVELLQALEECLDIDDAKRAMKEPGGISLKEAKAKLGL